MLNYDHAFHFVFTFSERMSCPALIDSLSQSFSSCAAERLQQHLESMEIEHDRVGDSCRNRLNNVSACITAASDDHDFHRTIDVTQIENRLGQIHFFPCRNENGGVKDFPTDLINGPVPVANFGSDAAGAGKTLFHLLAIFRTNQQDFVKATGHVTTTATNYVVPLGEVFVLKAELSSSLFFGTLRINLLRRRVY
jgi:hypothetical protein